MQEDKQDAQRTDIFHKEDIEMEISANTQSATIGEFVMNQFVRHEPANQDTGQESHNRQENLSRHKVEDIEQRLFEKMQRAASGAQ